jgi:hypothetical protein
MYLDDMNMLTLKWETYYEAGYDHLRVTLSANIRPETWLLTNQTKQDQEGGFCLQMWDSHWRRGEVFGFYSPNLYEYTSHFHLREPW